MTRPLTVLKFGSSVLRDAHDLPRAVTEIYAHVRRGHRVLAVVSALGSTTNDLLARAKAVSEEPSPHLLAHLLATGESTSAALLGLALERAGIPARKLSPDCLETEGPLLDSTLVAIDEDAVERLFAQADVAVLPGFVGRNAEGEVCLLGRGGSDLTALFVAARLDAAECVLVKDVDGLFERDPASKGPAPRRFEAITHDDAIALRSQVVQEKALCFAKDEGLRFQVGALGTESPTLVGWSESRFAPTIEVGPEPVPVTLLGLGAVGTGVYQRLVERPDRARIRRILVRDPRKHAARGIPAELLTDRPERILETESECVIELIGGVEPATQLIEDSLRRGRDVITANKAVISERGTELLRSAEEHGVSLRYSASVGGVVPVIEGVRRLAGRVPIQGFEGVLNGTANFILDALANGAEYDEAVREAQVRGLAEADPTLDLDGTDVAHKLTVLAREAFGTDRLQWLERSGLVGIDAAVVRKARESGHVLKLYGSCFKTELGPVASVRLCGLPAGHALANLAGEQNGALIVPELGEPILVHGKGAGRWPTAEAVLADLEDLVRSRTRARARASRASQAS